ncbi:hypothetical protein PMO31116_00508 [Pandoraea morbifera]|uniref:Uncharacterized protein n=1 Tax=Pandoraea morbifera TaxID=2508300 RepID=A0A5E4S0N8_9BURK|nr:hypothetical protein [Pandoraea morbifera]VVD69157.1 hypothetical protein PMO31116_00508 [Pandoraea morbifera]
MKEEQSKLQIKLPESLHKHLKKNANANKLSIKEFIVRAALDKCDTYDDEKKLSFHKRHKQ